MAAIAASNSGSDARAQRWAPPTQSQAPGELASDAAPSVRFLAARAVRPAPTQRGPVMAWPFEETAWSLPFLQESGIVTSMNGVFVDLNGGQMVKILLRDRESIQEAVRRFRKIVERSGLKKEMRKREVYEKPSVTKRRAKLRAVRRAQAQRKP